ncbi:MAG: hypothetical protein HN842_02070, partial [Gammaproteobacteria bacterium]|nr:hypothetical protein [Gammaproteobacteria bacterium]
IKVNTDPQAEVLPIINADVSLEATVLLWNYLHKHRAASGELEQFVSAIETAIHQVTGVKISSTVEETKDRQIPKKKVPLHVAIADLPVGHRRILRYLADKKWLTTSKCAEVLVLQHLPTKLSEVRQATGIECNKVRMESRFIRYTLDAQDLTAGREAFALIDGGAT